MSQRMVENQAFVADKKEFVFRKYHFLYWGMGFLFVFTASVIILSAYLLPQFLALEVTLGFLASILIGFCIFIYKKHRFMTFIELQNALFAGVAKLSSDFLVIIKHDGRIIYISPEARNKFSFLKNQGLEDIEALCELGKVNKKDRIKLERTLNEYKASEIQFFLPAAVETQQSLKLTLEPIGVYPRKVKLRKLNLAVSPITRPSGYFVLRNAQISFEEETPHLFERMNIGTYTLNAKSRLVSCNLSFATVLNYTQEELKNVPLEDICMNSGEELKQIEEQEQWLGELIFLTKDKKQLHSFVKYMASKPGRLKEGYGIMVPLSEMPQQIQTSYVSDVIIHSFDYSPIATIIIDSQGHITSSNQAFKTLLSSCAGLKNRSNLMQLLNSDSQLKVKHYLMQLGQSGKKSFALKPLDIGFAECDGLTATMYFNIIRNHLGYIKAVMVYFIDTTELRSLEQRFVHSQKMQAVGQLAGGIAHDFNNLLTAMIGFCDLLLLRHPAGDPSFADIMQIKQNGNRAANLVRQLLAFSRKQTLQPEVIHISDIFADLTNLIGRLIGENIELKMVHGHDLKQVKVDQVQLEQVIVNLAVNARDAMENGGVLTIQTKNIIVDKKHPVDKNLVAPEDEEPIEDGDYVLIEVEDTGCGIKKELMSKIFEPFFSTKKTGSGTGLGLSTVYGIVKQTDGYIYVSSKLKKGTKFSIFLKAIEPQEKVAKKNTDQDVAHLQTKDLTGQGNVLLVEDEAPVRMFSVSALKKKGYTMFEADSAESALNIVKEKGEQIDLIVTDVIMPGMKGPDMVKEIYRTYPDIPVVFISGYAEDTLLQNFNDSETIFYFLPKPYTLKQLAMKVKEVLEEKPRKRDSSS